MIVCRGINMEDNPFPTPSLEKTAGNKKKRFALLSLAVALALLLIFLGSRFLGTTSEKKNENISPTPTEFIIPTDIPAPTSSQSPTPSPKPTSTPTPKVSVDSFDKTTGLDRKDLSVSVQNGSGEKGVAAKAADFLKGLGYNVTSTGNADNFDYADVTIQVKSSKSDFLSLIKKDLSASYTIGASSSDLTATSSSDALVIIGK